MKKSKQKIIVVLGMHRSGTSVTTKALQVLGVDLGDDLMPPVIGNNERGFWEDTDINKLEIALLEKMGSDWDRLTLLNEDELINGLAAEKKAAASLLLSKMNSTDLFGFKDPRTVILMPFWKAVFQEISLVDHYVIAIRNPINVAKSLLQRDNIPLEAGILLWSKHMIGILRHTHGKPCVVVDYDLLLESPSLEIRRVADALLLSFDGSCQQRLNSFEKEFVDRDLRHHTASLEELENSDIVPGFVKEAYLWMLKLAKDLVVPGDVELISFWVQFEKTWRSFSASYQYMDRLRLLVKKLETKAASYEEERINYSNELEMVRQNLVQITNGLSVSEKKHLALQLQFQHVTDELSKSRKLQSEYKDLHQKTLAQRDNREASYKELHKAHNQAVAERDEAHKSYQNFILENEKLQAQLNNIVNSNSWRLTRGFRAIRRYLITFPIRSLRRKLR